MLTQVKQSRYQRGIGLLELMLSLSIIAILLVMATRYFMVANESQKLNNAISEINGIAGGAANYDIAFPGYVDMTMQKLIQGRFIPASLGGVTGDGTGTNPWGGNINVNTVNNGFQVMMYNVPNDGEAPTTCTKLQNMINTSVKGSAVCDGGTVTVTFH